MTPSSDEKNMVLGIIPARYDSSRLPGKLLKTINEKPILWWVYHKAVQCQLIDRVLVATDDERIASTCETFNMPYEWTSREHTNGTDRCAEVASRHEQYQWVINIQGDEPFIIPGEIDSILSGMQSRDVPIATAATPILSTEELIDPSKVKVILNARSEAIYFSRQAIPYVQGKPSDKWLEHHAYLRHIGLYAFKRDIILKVSRWSSPAIQLAESLEQLKWLYEGIPIFVNVGDYHGRGIDTADDLEWARSQSHLLI